MLVFVYRSIVTIRLLTCFYRNIKAMAVDMFLWNSRLDYYVLLAIVCV